MNKSGTIGKVNHTLLGLWHTTYVFLRWVVWGEQV